MRRCCTKSFNSLILMFCRCPGGGMADAEDLKSPKSLCRISHSNATSCKVHAGQGLREVRVHQYAPRRTHSQNRVTPQLTPASKGLFIELGFLPVRITTRS